MTMLMKRAFYGVMRRGGIYQYARHKRRHHALILTYHGVLSHSSDSYVNRNCVSARMFEFQMRWLKQNYHILPLSQLVEALRGKKPLLPFSAAVTFDDGFRNNFTVAFPILVRYNIPATVFLTTDLIGRQGRLWTEQVDYLIYSAAVQRLHIQMNGSYMEFDLATPQARERASDRIRGFLKTLNPSERQRHILELDRQVNQRVDFLPEQELRERYDFLNWDEIRTMAEHNIEFGSHTCTHAILAYLSPVELEDELLNSRAKIENELQQPCKLFSYPNGTARDFTQRDQLMLEKLGFEAACSQIHGFNKPGEPAFALKRINIARSESFSFFMAKATGVWGEIKRVAGSVAG